jgi:hypothetical protein
MDCFDSAFYDETYSGYRGQQFEELTEQLKAIIKIKSCVSDGGLVGFAWGHIFPFYDPQGIERVRESYKEEVKKAENAAMKLNQANGSCFEAKKYNYVPNDGNNCTRLYETTYISNVNYVAIWDQFLDEMTKNASLYGFVRCYLPKKASSSCSMARFENLTVLENYECRKYDIEGYCKQTSDCSCSKDNQIDNRDAVNHDFDANIFKPSELETNIRLYYQRQ